MAMHLTPDNRLKKLVVIGDRVLIKPTRPDERTASGLYLPPGVQEKEKVQQGYVIKTGPGYAIPMPVDDEPWKQDDDQVKYVPLQAKEGDLAIFSILILFFVCFQNIQAQKGIDSLIQAEKNFAAYSVANSTKEAFLKFLDS